MKQKHEQTFADHVVEFAREEVLSAQVLHERKAVDVFLEFEELDESLLIFLLDFIELIAQSINSLLSVLVLFFLESYFLELLLLSD